MAFKVCLQPALPLSVPLLYNASVVFSSLLKTLILGEKIAGIDARSDWSRCNSGSMYVSLLWAHNDDW